MIGEDPRRKEIIRVARDNKEIAAQIIRMWLQSEKKAKAPAQGVVRAPEADKYSHSE